MYCLAAFIVIVALWSTPSVQSIDCTDQDVVTIEVLKCFTKFGVFVDEDAAGHDCRNTEPFRSAVSCFMGILRTCQISLKQDPALLPNTKKLIDGIDFLCEHITDSGAECFTRKKATIIKCAKLKSGNVFAVSRDQSLTFIACTMADAFVDCTREQLGVCDGMTKEIITNYLMDASPPACSGGSPEHKEL